MIPDEVTLEGCSKPPHLTFSSEVIVRAEACTAFILSYLSVTPGERVSEEYAKDTTWTSAALVLMAAAYMDTRSPYLLSTITGFPLPFVDLVVRINDIDDCWDSKKFSEFTHLQTKKLGDLNYLRFWFGGLHEEILGRLTPQLTLWLHTARAGILFGGEGEAANQYHYGYEGLLLNPSEVGVRIIQPVRRPRVMRDRLGRALASVNIIGRASHSPESSSHLSFLG